MLSPFQAILDYEIANQIPLGWINYSLQSNSPTGAWHRLERGEITLDEAFFKEFNADFRNLETWRRFLKAKKITTSNTDKYPEIDGEPLFWSMMNIAKTLDPYMFPALLKLKQSGQFVIGALSNTTILPDDSHPGSDELLKSQFDFFISSAHTGLRKPEAAIYEAAYKAMNEAAREKGWKEGMKREDVVFLDDIGVNLKGAKKAGFRTIKVNLGKVGEAVRELEEITGMKLSEGRVNKGKL